MIFGLLSQRKAETYRQICADHRAQKYQCDSSCEGGQQQHHEKHQKHCWRQMAQGHRSSVLTQSKEVPSACFESIFQKSRESLNGTMTGRQCGREINLPAGAPDPSIKFVILISDQLLVVHTHSVKNRSEERRVGKECRYRW